MTYDGNNNMLTKLVNHYGEHYRLYIMTYDGNGKMLTKLTQRWNGTSWYDYQMENWSYDPDGNLLMYESMRSDGSSGSRETYMYDAAGNWLTLLKEKYSGGVWNNSTLETRTFDGSGNILNWLTQKWISNAWVNNSQTSFTYDADGNRLSHLQEIFASGKTTKWEYEYSPGKIIAHAYKLVGGVWIPDDGSYINIWLNVEGEQQLIYANYGYTIDLEYIANPTQLLADISPYQTVYYGYPPEACATVSVSATGGTPPYTYEWSNGETSPTIEVCPTESTEYTVVITDAIGCQVQACTRVCVIDVRCGPKLDKVLLCHLPDPSHSEPHTLCVAQEAVPAHLAHGDLLGACGIDHTCTDELKSAPADVVVLDIEQDMFIKAYPNPVSQSAMVTYLVNQPDKVTIRLFNSMGQPVMTLFEGHSPEGEIQEMEVDLGSLQPGIYLLILQQADGSRITEKLLKQ